MNVALQKQPKEIYLCPAESSETYVAWSKVENLSAQGWKLFQSLPVLTGYELSMGQYVIVNEFLI